LTDNRQATRSLERIDDPVSDESMERKIDKGMFLVEVEGTNLSSRASNLKIRYAVEYRYVQATFSQGIIISWFSIVFASASVSHAWNANYGTGNASLSHHTTHPDQIELEFSVVTRMQSLVERMLINHSGTSLR
jgi:hypothetical protein